jgi:P-aminobenzoate N-oxygenase AurF
MAASREAALHNAVRRARLAGEPDRGSELAYISRFQRWEAEASVRNKRRRTVENIAREEQMGLSFFPSSSVPVAEHPTVQALGPAVRRELQIRALYTYLDFTAELEQTVVNPITQLISRRRLGVMLPPAMEEDAYKIYADEAWHALFSDDLQRQVELATRVPSIRLPHPQFTGRLAEIERDLDSGERHLARVFFAIVSETLISSFLADVPKDEGVARPIRDLVADHAIDEGRHHAYFSHLLGLLWPELSIEQRLTIGSLLPEFIHAFLEPDVTAVAAMLVESGLDDDATAEVLTDVYGAGAAPGTVEEAARHTLSHLARVGVFDEPETRAAFLEAGIAVRT